MQLNELEMEPYTAAAATLAINPPSLPERPPSCNHGFQLQGAGGNRAYSELDRLT